jgi:hypothetical protein
VMAGELAPLGIRVNVGVPRRHRHHATGGYFTIDGGQTCL